MNTLKKQIKKITGKAPYIDPAKKRIAEAIDLIPDNIEEKHRLNHYFQQYKSLTKAQKVSIIDLFHVASVDCELSGYIKASRKAHITAKYLRSTMFQYR